MSRNIFNELIPKYSDEYVTYFVVDRKRPETLADYVRRVRIKEKNISLSTVQRNSKNKIASSYVSRIENGIVKNVTPDKLSALAEGLGVPEDEIFDVARGKLPITEDDLQDDEEVAALFYKYKILKPAAKKEIARLIRILDREIDDLGKK